MGRRCIIYAKTEHFFRRVGVARFTFLLPSGYIAYQSDLGSILRRSRKDAYLKQEVAAAMVGVGRPILSQIECGRSVPSPTTLDALMALYELDWADVAIAGSGTRRHRRLFDGTLADESRRELCRDLRSGRKAKNLSLSTVAAAVGISASQLSRVERGEFKTTDLLEPDPDRTSKPKEYRLWRFKSKILEDLAEFGATKV